MGSIYRSSTQSAFFALGTMFMRSAKRFVRFVGIADRVRRTRLEALEKA